ncbi:chemotaxis protein CheR [Hymenobacter glacieicola]|uniref:protein-glutamate O-methyltransferase n=2 Tax=Hymenobacter glacieicola TaxID=1562124 RepID=A0ABQ1X5W6_9BACT|nr:chemotaxis protein CheR [Hymenobacter glacieicola]
MGGSAGSLEAFERFFGAMPTTSGMAFVVVMHLLPNHDGDLAGVLQRYTDMPVVEVADGMQVQPNTVYVIPPNWDLSLLHGTLLLLPPTQAPALRQPIDFFLQSLAKDAREQAICVIFSGLGSDGSTGLKLVMENYGMVMVQEPKTALYDSMPRAALATEFVDFVLPPEQMPAKLLDYVERPLLARPSRGDVYDEPTTMPAHALQKIFLLIRAQTGHDFSFYKRNTVFRRIERRMNAHQIKEFGHYVRYLQENPQEVESLFKELLIGVTKFFRDSDAFESLKVHLRTLVQARESGSTIRVWAPGCSTGEEAYSLAMTLLECLDEVDPSRHLKIQLFATDISPEGVSFARQGLYSNNITADVNPERLQRFFYKENDHYQIRKEVRDLVVFALHNIHKDAPFTKLDLLCCRNLLIYLSAELQKSLLPVFHYSLNPGGLLFLGPSENITGSQDLFQPLDLKWKISRRNDSPTAFPRLTNFPFALAPHPTLAPAPPALMSSATSTRRQGGAFASLVQTVLLRTYAPPAVVVNPKGEILYIHGRTGRYLEPAPGLSGMNLFEMAREDLAYELSAAVHRAAETHEEVTVDNARLQTDSGQQLVRLTIKPLDEPSTLSGLLLVVFEEQPTPRRMRKAGRPGPDLTRDEVVANLEKELQYTKYRLQTSLEEMESSLEEMKSINEELQSANEELQSTNEEAMTNKEEMQSLNEELMTLNMQYMVKTEQLSESANDMKNLLDATEIAIIFLDNSMTIKRFTPPVERIIPLVPTDVGRPLMHFASNLRYEHLLRDVRQVLERLTSVSTNIQTVSGEWYTMRILPYRTLDNYISGAVITFTDVTGMKVLENQLQEAARLAESVVETVREPLLVLDGDLRVVTASPSFLQAFRLTAPEVQGQPLASLSNGAWDNPGLERHLQALLAPAILTETATEAAFDSYVLEAQFPELGRRRLVLYGRAILRGGHQTNRLLLGIETLEVVA